MINKKATAFAVGAVFLFIGAYLLLENIFPGFFPELNAETSLWLVFLIGLLTSFHCIAMCGGFVVGYSASNSGTADCATIDSKKAAKTGQKRKSGRSGIFSHLQYGAGKLLSYTAIGAAFGLLGGLIVFTPQLRGIAAIIAGLFLLAFGLNQLGLFSALRGISLPAPKALTRFVVKNKKRGPFFVGLMNGLMIACGPLQAMYIFAASTGSAIRGAEILLAFGLGTLPLMLFFGFFVSLVSKQLTQKILRFSGVIVILLGLMLFANGTALMGINFSPIPGAQQNAIIPGAGNNTTQAAQEIRMEVNAFGYSPSNFTIKQGVPVKWVINVTKLTGCNNEILVPALNIQKKLAVGEQVIEFTPEKLGTIQFSCWMGMLRGSITVEPNNSAQANSTPAGNSAASAPAKQDYYPQSQQAKPANSCGGGSGASCGCGCGG